MASRKDQKGRVLQKGEFQRADGRYQYSYTDIIGKRRYLYAKTLPELRTMEKEQKIAEWSGATNYGSNVSLNYMFDRYMATKFGIKESTYASYIQMYDRYVRDEFGQQFIRKITCSDVLGFYGYLLKHRKVSIRTVEYVHMLLHPAFELAVQDGVLVKNPTKGTYGKIKKLSGQSSRKIHALTIEEQKAFLSFIDGHPVWGRYFPIFQVMVGTGMRAGELCGLRWEDIDVEGRVININHALVLVKKTHDNESDRLTISIPKTAAGIRDIPVMDRVMDALKQEYIYAEARAFPNTTIDGFTDFVFTNQNGNVYTSTRLDLALKRIVKAYNRMEVDLAKVEDRDPFILPHISNHMLRHTFCTRLCERDVNVKVIQTIMGHASIKITLDIYAEVSREKQVEEIKRMSNEIDVF